MEKNTSALTLRPRHFTGRVDTVEKGVEVGNGDAPREARSEAFQTEIASRRRFVEFLKATLDADADEAGG